MFQDLEQRKDTIRYIVDQKRYIKDIKNFVVIGQKELDSYHQQQTFKKIKTKNQKKKPTKNSNKKYSHFLQKSLYWQIDMSISRNQELKICIQTLFQKSRTIQFLKKNLHTVEQKVQHHLRFVDKSHCEKSIVEYRCQRSKCTFKLTFEKKQKCFQLVSQNPKHSHPEVNPTFELDHLKKIIEKKSDYVYQEYFVSRINHQEYQLQLIRPCLILEDMKNKQIFSLSSMTQNKKYKVQLKKKFDNVIQNLRRDFKLQYPDITCIEDSFQAERQNKSIILRQKHDEIQQTEEEEFSQTTAETKFQEEESASTNNLQITSIQDDEEEEDYSSTSSSNIRVSESSTTIVDQKEQSQQSLLYQTSSQIQWNSSKIQNNIYENEEELEDIYQESKSTDEIEYTSSYNSNIEEEVDIPINYNKINKNELLNRTQNMNNQFLEEIDNDDNDFEYETIIYNNQQIIKQDEVKDNQEKQLIDSKPINNIPFGYFDWIYQNNIFY